jgi:hypothetical protein
MENLYDKINEINDLQELFKLHDEIVFTEAQLKEHEVSLAYDLFRTREKVNDRIDKIMQLTTNYDK